MIRHTEVAIVGGGLAGSTAAAMLGRQGISTLVVDPHEFYPLDFRCEKLDASQLRLLRETGLADEILPATTLNDEVWIARYGHLVARRRHDQRDILYADLVNAMRGLIGGSAQSVVGKAMEIATGSDEQRITLADGSTIVARLLILANGLNSAMRRNIGLERQEISSCHSIAIGFDVSPAGRPAFKFPALTYGPESPASRMAYLTFFPMGSGMRANLFVYRDMHDPWLRAFREKPDAMLLASLPGLGKLLGRFEVRGPVKIRPIDLYVTTGQRRDGIVLVGDAFGTSCPAAGTGVNKVFTDVVRLCKVHVPDWLATPGMGEAKIAAFYDDPVKTACDAASEARAFQLRSLSTATGMNWRLRRVSRALGQIGAGALERLHDWVATAGDERMAATAAERQS